MTTTPDHYEPTARGALAIRVVWTLTALAAIVLDACRRWLAATAPRWQGVLTGALIAMAAWNVTGLALELARWAAGETGVAAATNESAVLPSGPLPIGDPRLQPDYADPLDETPMPRAASVPDLGPPPFLTPGLLPHWPQIDASAREHGLDPWAWAAVVVIECPEGVNSRPAPSCQYANGSDAGGLAQVTGGTAAVIASASGYPCVVDRFDPVTSLRCGAYHFRDLLRAVGRYWSPTDELPALQLAAIAYNAGAGSVAYTGGRASAAAGGDVCAGIPAGFDGQTHRYCRDIRTMWQATLTERGNGAAGLPTARRLEAGR